MDASFPVLVVTIIDFFGLALRLLSSPLLLHPDKRMTTFYFLFFISALQTSHLLLSILLPLLLGRCHRSLVPL